MQVEVQLEETITLEEVPGEILAEALEEAPVVVELAAPQP